MDFRPIRARAGSYLYLKKQLRAQELKKLELHSAAPRATLTPRALSCSPNFLRAQYFDVRTLTHELIVKLERFINRVHAFSYDQDGNGLWI